MSEVNDNENTTPSEKLPFSDLIRKNLDDIRLWAKDNANSIIKNIAYSAGLTTILMIFAYLSSDRFVSNVAAADVAEYMNKSSNSGEYSQTLETTPEYIKDSSIHFFDVVSGEGKTESCSGTVIEKLDRNKLPPLYVASSAKHCLFNSEGEYIGDSDLVISLIQTSANSRDALPFRVVSYESVDDKDLIFLALEQLNDEDTNLIPIGSDKLSSFNSTSTLSLTGIGYPSASIGLPVPINLSTDGGSALFGDPSKYIIPVDRFPLSGGGSGSGLFDSDGNLTAVFTNIRYDWWELDQKYYPYSVHQ